MQAFLWIAGSTAIFFVSRECAYLCSCRVSGNKTTRPEILYFFQNAFERIRHNKCEYVSLANTRVLYFLKTMWLSETFGSAFATFQTWLLRPLLNHEWSNHLAERIMMGSMASFSSSPSESSLDSESDLSRDYTASEAEYSF